MGLDFKPSFVQGDDVFFFAGEVGFAMYRFTTLAVVVWSVEYGTILLLHLRSMSQSMSSNIIDQCVYLPSQWPVPVPGKAVLRLAPERTELFWC